MNDEVGAESAKAQDLKDQPTYYRLFSLYGPSVFRILAAFPYRNKSENSPFSH